MSHYKKTLENELHRQLNQQEYQHSSPIVQVILNQRIEPLKHDIKSLNKHIEALIQAHEKFRQKKECLENSPWHTTLAFSQTQEHNTEFQR